MKKIIALVLALIMVFALAACGQSAAPATAAPETKTEAPAETEADSAPAAAGKVYYLNFKPELDETAQALAAMYTEQTGVPVKVVTAASGSYSDTLTAEMGKSEAPTLFQIGNAWGILDWGEYAMDLDGTAILDQLATDMVLRDDAGAAKAVGYCVESYGIITNKALLEQAGYTLEDITDFASLKAVADDIHARAAELGFDAFTSAGLDPSSSWRFTGHLTNLPLYYEFRDDGVGAPPATVTGAYLDNYRAIWDLYINDAIVDKATLMSATGDQAEAEFGEGKAVFFQNGTWEFSALTENYGLNPDDLTMIPIYCGVEGEEKAGLCTGSENYWAINANSSAEDQQATMDFITWCVTSEEGTTMMSEQFGPCPFKESKEPANVFAKAADAYLDNGCYPVTWAFNSTPNVDSWREGIRTALGAYSANPTDDTWAGVVTAFVDGWAIEYNTVMG